MADRSGFVRLALLATYQSVADRLGLNAAPLLQAAGLTPKLLSEHEQFVPFEPVVELLEESARLSNSPTFGLQMACDRVLSDSGLVSILISLQPSLDALLRTLSRYRNAIFPPLIFSVERHCDIAVIRLDIMTASDRQHRQVNELVLATAINAIRFIFDTKWQPECVHSTYPCPAAEDRPVHAAALGANRQYSADLNGMTVTVADLERTRQPFDPGLIDHAATLLRPILERGEATLAQRVQEAIVYLLGSSQATLAEAAALLHVHSRTLQRRLEQDGVTFSELVDKARGELASKFLANPHLSITEVAEALGYSSTGAFSRWYRREFGRPPHQARRP